jgi:hypothetical protein
MYIIDKEKEHGIAGSGTMRIFKQWTNEQSVWSIIMDIVGALFFVTCETEVLTLVK